MKSKRLKRDGERRPGASVVKQLRADQLRKQLGFAEQSYRESVQTAERVALSRNETKTGARLEE